MNIAEHRLPSEHNAVEAPVPRLAPADFVDDIAVSWEHLKGFALQMPPEETKLCCGRQAMEHIENYDNGHTYKQRNISTMFYAYRYMYT